MPDAPFCLRSNALRPAPLSANVSLDPSHECSYGHGNLGIWRHLGSNRAIVHSETPREADGHGLSQLSTPVCCNYHSWPGSLRRYTLDTEMTEHHPGTNANQPDSLDAA